MRFKLLSALIIAVFASVVCYDLAFATQSSIKQKLFGPTKPNDTLWIIASHSIPAHSTLTVNQAMVAIYANNISAFSNGNMNLLLKNKWLKIPSVQEMRAVSPNQAFWFVKHHEIAWQNKESVPEKFSAPFILKARHHEHQNQPVVTASAKTDNIQSVDNVLEQAPPKELDLPYTPLLRPVASLNFVFMTQDELRNIQKDKILPLVLKPSVIAQHIQVLAQEPMSALQTFDMWTLLSSQLQGLALRFDNIEKHQQQLQMQMSVLKQHDIKQDRQIQAIQQQLQQLNVNTDKSVQSLLASSKRSEKPALIAFFNSLDDELPMWPWLVAVFATALILLMAARRYVAKRNAIATSLAPAFHHEPKQETKSEEPEETVVVENHPVEEIRIRPKEGSLHEAVAEILSSNHHDAEEYNEVTEVQHIEETEVEADFSVEDEMSSLLDLARAYSDMGDRDNAQSLLERVIAEGSDIQRKDAQHLMNQL